MYTYIVFALQHTYQQTDSQANGHAQLHTYVPMWGSGSGFSIGHWPCKNLWFSLCLSLLLINIYANNVHIGMHPNSQIYPLTPFVPLKLSTWKVRVIQGNYIVSLNIHIYIYTDTHILSTNNIFKLYTMYVYIYIKWHMHTMTWYCAEDNQHRDDDDDGDGDDGTEHHLGRRRRRLCSPASRGQQDVFCWGTFRGKGKI